MEKTCLDCGTIVKGRTDKKFCDDQCRNNFNNRLKSEDGSLLKQINQALKKNRNILQKLNPNGKTRISRDKLLKQGFDQAYHTHIYETQKGAVYRFVYEHGYLMLENDEILLVKNDKQVNWKLRLAYIQAGSVFIWGYGGLCENIPIPYKIVTK